MNFDFSYLASKCFNLTSKNRSKSCTCPSISLSVQYLMQNHNWIDFGKFFNFFCKFPKRHIKKRMTTCKIIVNPQTKEPKICHALATTSAFNLKMCRIKMTVARNVHIICQPNLGGCQRLSPIGQAPTLPFLCLSPFPESLDPPNSQF